MTSSKKLGHRLAPHSYKISLAESAGLVIRSGRANKRGDSFCSNTMACNYCHLFNKTGKIQSTTMGIIFNSMRKASCRNTNLIYAITCTVCKMQYIGQTLLCLKLKDKLMGHLGDIKICDTDKPVAVHFTQAAAGHNHKNYIEITVLEFIKITPRSPQALAIRQGVESKWSPQGINLRNPKEYRSHLTK